MGNNIGLDNTQKFGDHPNSSKYEENDTEARKSSIGSVEKSKRRQSNPGVMDKLDMEMSLPFHPPKGGYDENGKYIRYSLPYRIF